MKYGLARFWGSAIPLVIAALVSLARIRWAYLVWFVAGFCLIANGAYIGVGAFDPVGDAEELVALGVSRWVLLGFGVVAFGAGLWIWHRGGERLGFGRDRKAVVASHARGVFVVCVLVTLVGMQLGNRGS